MKAKYIVALLALLLAMASFGVYRTTSVNNQDIETLARISQEQQGLVFTYYTGTERGSKLDTPHIKLNQYNTQLPEDLEILVLNSLKYMSWAESEKDYRVVFSVKSKSSFDLLLNTNNPSQVDQYLEATFVHKCETQKNSYAQAACYERAIDKNRDAQKNQESRLLALEKYLRFQQETGNTMVNSDVARILSGYLLDVSGLEGFEIFKNPNIQPAAFTEAYQAVSEKHEVNLKYYSGDEHKLKSSAYAKALLALQIGKKEDAKKYAMELLNKHYLLLGTLKENDMDGIITWYQHFDPNSKGVIHGMVRENITTLHDRMIDPGCLFEWIHVIERIQLPATERRKIAFSALEYLTSFESEEDITNLEGTLTRYGLTQAEADAQIKRVAKATDPANGGKTAFLNRMYVITGDKIWKDKAQLEEAKGQ